MDYRFCITLPVTPYDFRLISSVNTFERIDIW